MTNLKHIKRALFSSVIALLVCFTMLLGTTFAWFTDSVTSSNNIIQTGTLKIGMYWAEGDEDPTSVTWANASEGAIFNNDKWEPGYTVAKHIKVSNEGTLDLKYQLAIVPNGEVSKLAEVIDVYYIENGQQIDDRADLEGLTKRGTLADLINTGIANGNLYADDSENGAKDYVATIVLKMQETAGNEYQNLKIGDSFSIQLLATQLASESDSFDENYDKDAKYTVSVKNATELLSAIKNVEDGYTIELTDNVTFDKDACSELNGWYEGIYYEGDKSFTIDLNGKTITNDSAVNDYLMLFKNTGSKANTITFKNGTIEAASSAYSAIATSTTNAQKITINLEDVNLIGNNSNGAVAKIRGGAVLNVNAGTVITGKDNYVGIEAVGTGTVVNVYEGTKFYQNGTSSYVGALIGASYNATVNVYGGYGVSAKGGFIVMTSGGIINVSGGEWIANTNGTYADGTASVLIAQNDKNTYTTAGNSVVNVTGGTFCGGYNCYGNAAGDAQINISVGNFNANPSAYAKGKVTDNGNGIWTVSGYEVSSAKELADAIAAGNAVTLTQDIDLGKIDLTDAITNNVVIDANGHKITTTESYGIEVTPGKNVTISNAKVEMTKEGDYITYAAGLKIANGDYAGATITLQNCSISMANGDWSYAVNMPAGVKNLNLVIDNCVLEGAVAVQCWGDNNTITITDSDLVCNYTTNATFTSYCVSLQNDGTNVSENNTLVIDNCKFSYSGVDNFNKTIYSVEDFGTDNNVTVTNCTYGEKVAVYGN